MKKANYVSKGSYSPCLIGKVFEKECNVLLNFGTEISVVSQQLVDSCHYTESQ